MNRSSPPHPRRSPMAALIVLAAVGLASCDEGAVSGFPPTGHDPSYVRVENASRSILSNVVVHLPEDETLTADMLVPGQRTAYRLVSTAYRVATVTGLFDGEPFALQVIDYVGEEPLGEGRFTYVLDVFDPESTAPSVTLTLRED